LYAEVQNGHASVIHSGIKQLMEAGCNIDVQTKDGGTPLYIAAPTP
jgi:hypothetical protein